MFVGDGALRGQLEKEAAGAANIRFLPFFPASKIPSVLAAADAHIITVKRGLEGVVVPSKLYGILAAGKPVVAVAPQETDAASLGASRGFGVSADPDRPAEVVAVVRTLLADPGSSRQNGSRGERSGQRLRPAERGPQVRRDPGGSGAFVTAISPTTLRIPTGAVFASHAPLFDGSVAKTAVR